MSIQKRVKKKRREVYKKHPKSTIIHWVKIVVYNSALYNTTRYFKVTIILTWLDSLYNKLANPSNSILCNNLSQVYDILMIMSLILYSLNLELTSNLIIIFVIYSYILLYSTYIKPISIFSQRKWKLILMCLICA